MNKKQILEKAKKEKKDEGYEVAKVKGQQLGFSIFLILSIFLIMFNLINRENNDAIYSLFWCFFSGKFYQRYKFSENRINLLGTVATGIVSFLSLVNYVMGVLK